MHPVSQELKEYLIESYSTSLFLIGYFEAQGNFEVEKRPELVRSIFFERGKIEFLHTLFEKFGILIIKEDDIEGIEYGKTAYLNDRNTGVMEQVNSALDILTKNNNKE